MHGFYQGSPSSGTDFETRYYTDSYYGRPKGIRYPGGVGVAFLYNAGGYLVQEKDASSSYTIRQVNARDSRNQVIQSSLANGTLTHTAEYYDATGQMKAIVVTGNGGQLHKLDYDYDTFGNLEYQSTGYDSAVSMEIFYYDELHRLTQSSRSLPGGSAIDGALFSMAGPIFDAVEGGGKAFVLLDPDGYLLNPDYRKARREGSPAIRNLLAVSKSGGTLWKAELPEDADYYRDLNPTLDLRSVCKGLLPALAARRP